ncbi:MAG: dimethyl sulfoxide reductase anchor subunit [Hyphomicrobiaceae bacterium]|nr:dimethyl sulfoxide reductase anchor subunit [Hyphomicrobiaceae bacterium]
MHPAYSVIFFTTASGAGLGLLAWLGLGNALELLPKSQWFGFFGVGLAVVLLSAGLMSSTFHLGRPERAWRAFSQWRSSWLSREGVSAVLTYIPTGVLGIGWGIMGITDGAVAVAGVVAAVLAVITIYTTGMIYASLPTIRAWYQPLVPIVYIALGLASGAVLLTLLLAIFEGVPSWAVWLSVAAIAAGFVLKSLYWSTVAGEKRTYTVGAATGLGRFGKVRPLDPPHTMANFVMREMGYEVARKHAEKLRGLVHLLLFVVPAALLLATLVVGSPLTLPLVLLALGSTVVGLVTERWLFFAEAEHVSMLYYGKEAV